MYIDSDFKYEVLKKTSNEAFQALWLEIHFTNAANITYGVIYRQHNSPETFIKNLKSFFNKYNVLHESHYGLRERRSTDHAILDILNKIQSYMDKGMFSCGVFIDLQKAFDTIDHAIILQKLFNYGVRGIVNDWFSSYLISKVQTTQIGSHVSEKQNTLCGVPQGSVLGPLLFPIYVNAIYKTNWNSFYLRMTPTFRMQSKSEIP